jgi:predicted ATPase
VVAAQEEVRTLLGERPIESLLELPLMTDPDREAVLNVLAALFTPAFFTDLNLLVLHLCRMVSLSLRHGNAAAAVHGYAWYGVVLGPTFKQYREGYAFGKLACELVERYGFASASGKALYSMEIISYWTRPISVSLELIREGFQRALRAGDFQIACYCCNHIVTDRLSLGHPLEEIYQESVARLDFARKAGFVDVQHVIHHTQRYVQQLRGLSRAFGSLSGDDFDEESFEAGLTPDRMSTMRCWYWVHKLQARFLCGDYAEAREAGARAAELTFSSISHIQLLDLHLFRGLTLAACLGAMRPEEQGAAREELRKHQEQLAEWASTRRSQPSWRPATGSRRGWPPSRTPTPARPARPGCTGEPTGRSSIWIWSGHTWPPRERGRRRGARARRRSTRSPW